MNQWLALVVGRSWERIRQVNDCLEILVEKSSQGQGCFNLIIKHYIKSKTSFDQLAKFSRLMELNAYQTDFALLPLRKYPLDCARCQQAKFACILQTRPAGSRSGTAPNEAMLKQRKKTLER